MYKILDLFSGLGGFSLGLERTGHFKTIAFCDNDKFSKLILDKHWKGVKIYNDVREISKEKFKEDGIEFPDIITGGFPCQPFSVAGKQKGTSDDRHLWPEMFRIIKAFKPRYVIGENVRGIVNIQEGVVFETVCTDLESEGYEVQPFIIPAAGVGAPHRRERVWIIATLADSVSNDERREISRSDEEETRIQEEHRTKHSTTGQSSRTSAIRNGDNGYEKRINVADTNDEGFRTRIGGSDNDHETESRSWRADGTRSTSDDERHNSTSTKVEGMDVADTESIDSDVRGLGQYQGERSGQGEIGGASSQDDTNSYGKRLEGFRGKHKLRNSEEKEQTSGDGWWQSEPNVGRVAHGVSGRVHRLKALGNSIVPQIAEEIGRAIIKAEYEME
jgi:DNA (cytosine-5)-methyltransferase 1